MLLRGRSYKRKRIFVKELILRKSILKKYGKQYFTLNFLPSNFCYYTMKPETMQHFPGKLLDFLQWKSQESKKRNISDTKNVKSWSVKAPDEACDFRKISSFKKIIPV